MSTEIAARPASSIRFEGVWKSYPRASHPAVEDITFSVAPGEMVVLLGPSGCGKTTILKLTNRLLEPTRGTILIDDRDISTSVPHLLRRQIGYVIQQAGLFPHMTVEQNVAVVPKLLEWDTSRISRRVDELLSLVGLEPELYRYRFPAQLSGGEQQRVGLARALAGRPSTLLMDEPFGALDAITRTRLQDELLRIHRQLGQTVLFVTHDVEEAVRLADRIAVMMSGRIVQFDTPSRVMLSPASPFVSDLVGSRDVLRRMSLTPVSAAALPVGDGQAGEVPWVPAAASLRTALSLLLESDAPELLIRGESGGAVGRLDLEAIHRAMLESSATQPAPEADS